MSTSEMHVVEQMRDARRRRERPWRGFVCGLYAAGLLLASYFWARFGLWESIGIGIATLIAGHMLFGIDPERRRFVLPPGIDQLMFQEAIAKARIDIDGIVAANKAIPSPKATALLNSITTRAVEIVDALEFEPVDFSRGQKFLDIYLGEVASVSAQYANTHSKASSDTLDAQFLELLAEVDRRFEAQQRSLIADDVLALDVDMSVLKKRLNLEGI